MNKKIILFSALALYIAFSIFFDYAIFYLLPALWLFYQLFLSDHIHYQPKIDYKYHFNINNKISNSITNGNTTISIDKNTHLLELLVKSSFSGYLFDPYLEISTESKCYTVQFFERGAKGKRFINISSLATHLHGKAIQIRINSKHCSIDNNYTLHTFDDSRIDTSRLLVISPHADDAEIAAFGLYSNRVSHVVTITAGEIEPETFKKFSRDSNKASTLKGLARAWDSVAIPAWGNQPFSNSLNLGYFCMQLSAMKSSPDESFHSLTSSCSDTRKFRQFNAMKLDSDSCGKATWNNLVHDLSELIDNIQPTAIITPHETLDSHPDHKHATLALHEALNISKHNPGHLLKYANHLSTTDMHPFGPAHTVASLPPSLEQIDVDSIYSFTLAEKDQLSKAVALDMMHDLRRSVKLKKVIRSHLQSLFINRKPPTYGRDPYFRKAIRQNEIFFVEELI